MADEKTTLFHGGICNDCDVAWCFWKNASWDTIRSSSAITYTNHFEIAKFNKYQYLFDPVACFLKSGNKEAFTSHFVLETEIIRHAIRLQGSPVISKWIYWSNLSLPTNDFFFLKVWHTILLMWIYFFTDVDMLFVLQFFDHPVIIDFLTDRWCGGYKYRKLSRLWWFFLSVWCLFDVFLFPLIFLLTFVVGNGIY